MRSLCLVILVSMLFIGVANATMRVHTDPSEMDSIQKPFADKGWANYSAENSYTGAIDRSVLQSGIPNKDSGVLISKERPEVKVTANKPSKAPETKIIYVKEHKPEADIIVTTSWCDESTTICH